MVRDPKRLLVIDDDAEYINACREFLEEDPFDAYIVHSTAEPDQAMSMFRQEKFDCVLIDNDLPGQSGLDVLSVLIQRQAEEAPATVVMTDKSDAQIAVQALKSGAQDYLTKDEMTPETLTKTVRSAIETVMLQRQQEQASKQFEHMALHDPLTGLANRTLFNNRLEHSVNMAERAGNNLAVLMIDMNGFKAINDTHGHEAGDAVLKEIAKRMEGCLRRTDTLARLGGDEFAILLESLAAVTDTYHVLRRLLATCDTPVYFGDVALKSSLSIGFAVYPDSANTPPSMIAQADEAMYVAKRGGLGFHAPHGFPQPMPIHQMQQGT